MPYAIADSLQACLIHDNENIKDIFKDYKDKLKWIFFYFPENKTLH